MRTVILFFGRPAPDAGESTDRFDRLDARFSVANRVVTAEALSLTSPDADMAGSGTLNLDTDALEGRVDVRAYRLPAGRLGVVLPITTGAVCLRCHGKSIAPEVSSAIRAAYPNDQATGFDEGDLRGVFWVELDHVASP